MQSKTKATQAKTRYLFINNRVIAKINTNTAKPQEQ
jgi:hypothetical protein